MGEKMVKVAKRAREASLIIGASDAAMRTLALEKLLSGLVENKKRLMEANKADTKKAQRAGVSASVLKRLELSEEKFGEILEEVRGVAMQEDTLWKKTGETLLDTGLALEKITVPLGVVCAVFEARPDALVQISSLSIRTGNAVILKGGSEVKETNRVLASVVRAALAGANLPADAVQLAESREAVKELLKLNEYIDLIIPRGSSSLVRFIQENSLIPVLGHADGVCHEYVDEHADIGKAVRICFDAKCQYPGVCNAMESLLVHQNIAQSFLPEFAKSLGGKVELRADNEAKRILAKNGFKAKKAGEKDWHTEYNDMVLSVKTVRSIGEAIRHVNEFGSKHTDGIITEDKEAAEKFLRQVDSSSVLWNASTRFADGYRYGKGAEVGISTGKLHSRGPSGAESLLTYKYLLKGNGHVVSDYAGAKARRFLHKKIL